ncbi:MAG: hypothetical protein AB7L90_18715 [Hyphomicrobiaceae bacterium]
MSMKLVRTSIAGSIAVAATTTAAVAHPGSHHTMSFSELAAHLATGWHLAMLLGGVALATLVVLFAANRDRQQRAERPANNRRSGS